jgi:hypothetical protein
VAVRSPSFVQVVAGNTRLQQQRPTNHASQQVSIWKGSRHSWNLQYIDLHVPKTTILTIILGLTKNQKYFHFLTFLLY